MKKKNIILFIIGFGVFLIIITAINIIIKKSERESLKEKPTIERPAQRPVQKEKALQIQKEELEIEPSINPKEPLAN